MTDYTGRVRSYLVSIDQQLETLLSSVEEEDMYVDTLKAELASLDAAEAERIEKAEDEIKAVAENSKYAKIAAINADLEAAAKELTTRWEAAEEVKIQLKSQNETKEAQLMALKRELARLRSARQKSTKDFDKELTEKMMEATAAADREEEARRRSAANRISNTILAYKKSPQCQAPINELVPIDRSVSRIYQQMSYLMQGQ